MLNDTDLMRLREATNRHLSLDWKIADILLDEIARLREELDRKPEITPEDAAHAIQFFRGWDAPGSVTDRVFAALRAHAQKAVKP